MKRKSGSRIHPSAKIGRTPAGAPGSPLPAAGPVMAPTPSAPQLPMADAGAGPGQEIDSEEA
jgi:hypothetical protein